MHVPMHPGKVKVSGFINDRAIMTNRIREQRIGMKF